MAAFHGKSGTVSFTGGVFNVLSFSVEATADIAEATDMGDTWKSYLAGFKDWTASVDCLLDTTGIALSVLGSEATLTLETTTGKQYQGSAICVGLSPSLDKDDVAKVTFSFQGNGTLSENA